MCHLLPSFRFCTLGGNDTDSRFTIHGFILLCWLVLLISLLASSADVYFVS